jgi:hypothetical protein
MSSQRVGAERLAGLGATQFQHVAPRRVRSEIMIEADNPVHFRACQVQRLGNHRDNGGGDATERRLQCVQHGHRCAVLGTWAAMISAPRASLYGS